MDVYKTVREGVPAKGMLAWERQLRPAELMAVSSYVGTMLGSEPPNPKEPQGDRLVRQGHAPADEVEVATDEAASEAEAGPTAS
jgi:cytochrome c oxidase cbb3-type subunit 3